MIGVICDGVPEVRRAVREEVRRGAHHIKVYLSGAVDSPSDRVDRRQFSMEELRAIVEEATAANIYVAGHAYTSRAIDRGLECGVRSIEHGNLMDASSIPLFKQHEAFYVPTIVTYHALAARSRDGLLPATSRPSCEEVIDGAIGALEMAHAAGLPDRLRHGPVRRHARSAAAGVRDPVRGSAAGRPDQVGDRSPRPGCCSARGSSAWSRPARCRPAGHRREPAGGHPGAHHPATGRSGSS